MPNYLPALLTAIGATVGAFWSSINSSNKGTKIAELTTEIAQSITGGDTYPVILPTFKGDGKLTMYLITEGRYPVYELQVTILDQDFFLQLVKGSSNIHKEIAAIHKRVELFLPVGNIGPNQGKDVAAFDLDSKIGERNFLITLLARNGQVTEEMKLRWVQNNWSVAFRAYSQKGTLKRQVGTDYPTDQLWTN